MANRDNQPLLQGQQTNQFVASYNPPPPYVTQPPQYVTGQPLPQTITQGVVVVDVQNTAVLSQMQCERSRISVLIQCPYCKKNGNSVIKYEMGDGSWCCVLLFFCFCSILCWLPCCNEDCQDALHHCQFCNQLIGVCKYQTCQC